MDILENEDKYIYKKADFLKIGVAEGSFRKLMQDLELNTSEFCTTKVLSENNNRPTLYYTKEAYEKVIEHLKNKEKSKKSDTSIAVVQELNQAKIENQNLKNTLAVLEAKYTKENTEIRLKMKDMELAHQKENAEKELKIKELEGEYKRVQDNWKNSNELLKEKNEELERLKNRGFWARLFNK